MVKHVILWTLKPEFTEEEKAAARAEAKRRLESLNGKLDGLVSLRVITDRLPTSTADMMLDSVFTDRDALASYAVNPLHLEAAGYVRSVVASRACLDFEA
ncbi:MAG: Dabb family protein [Clostridia bacterium]|nr:Dabb family protein [Clostridia bacterium]